MKKHNLMYNTLLTYVTLLLLYFVSPFGICQTQNVGTIQGQVTDSQNNPLIGYTVSAVSQTDKVTYAAKTNSGGEFTLTNLPTGTWDVKVRHFSTLLAQRKVNFTANTELTVDFVIEGNGVISGFLLDAVNKLPIPNTGKIQVGLLTPHERIDRTYQGELSNGYFEVKDLLPGHYRIIDDFNGYVSSIPDSPIVTVFKDSHVGGTEVSLKPGASLIGRFIDAKNGQPISGVSVHAASEMKNTVYPARRYTHDTETNTNGEFYQTIPNDPDIYYAFTLIVSHPQYQTHRWRWDMSPAKNDYDLGELSLKPFLSLQGKVISSNSGYTVDRLKIQLKMHNKPADFFRVGAQTEHTVHSDAEGNFLLSGLHPIDYSMTTSRNDKIIAVLESVNPQSKKPLKIRLQKMKTLHGKVVDTKQNPIAKAKLYASRRSENRFGHSAVLATTQTDANGTFQMQVLETKPHLLSVNVSKKGYLSKVYQNVKIGKEPLIVLLQEAFVIKGRVFLPRDVPIEGYYYVKVFPKDVKMEPTLNPRTLIRPLTSKRFPVTETSFVLDGLLEEEYKLYIVGNNIAATEIAVKASANGDEVPIVADRPTVGIKGQVIWSDTGEPMENAQVSRSWYPWELSPYDMSLTLDRFQTDTDAQGGFTFSNLTQERYQLLIRVVKTVFEKETETYQRIHIHKQVTLPAGSDEIYPIYLGKADGTPF